MFNTKCSENNAYICNATTGRHLVAFMRKTFLRFMKRCAISLQLLILLN